MSSPAEPTPPRVEMPQIDRLRLEMVTFLYAAAVGYGFAVLDSAPWVLQPMDWSQVWSSLKTYWPGLWMYLWVFLFIAIDWLFIREVYFEENAYGKTDFVLDIVIVFCFVRMMHDGATAVDKSGAPVNFAYWWWLGVVFLAYIVWDFVRVRRKFLTLGGEKKTWRNAFRSQKWSLTADCAALVLFSLAYAFSSRLQGGGALIAVVLGTPLVYGAAAWAWQHDLGEEEPAAK